MDNKESLGAGITVISIIVLIGGVMGIFGVALNLIMSDKINQVLIALGQRVPTKLDYVISLVGCILNIIFITLILMKNKIGIFGYFTLAILTTVYNTIVNWQGSRTLSSLVLGIGILILYGYFIYKKRELYGFEKETAEVTN